VDELLLSAVECTGGGGIRQTEIQTAKPLAPEPSISEVAIGKLKRCKLPGADQTSAKLIQLAGRIWHSEIHELIKLVWNKQELPHEWKESISYIFTKRVIKLTAVIIEIYHSCQLHTKFYPTFFSVG
jgi:hypothetical protein